MSNQQVDWMGLALELEAQAKCVESQTVERSMLAAAHGLRLMGGEQRRTPNGWSPFVSLAYRLEQAGTIDVATRDAFLDAGRVLIGAPPRNAGVMGTDGEQTKGGA